MGRPGKCLFTHRVLNNAGEHVRKFNLAIKSDITPAVPLTGHEDLVWNATAVCLGLTHNPNCGRWAAWGNVYRNRFGRADLYSSPPVGNKVLVLYDENNESIWSKIRPWDETIVDELLGQSYVAIDDAGAVWEHWPGVAYSPTFGTASAQNDYLTKWSPEGDEVSTVTLYTGASRVNGLTVSPGASPDVIVSFGAAGFPSVSEIKRLTFPALSSVWSHTSGFINSRDPVSGILCGHNSLLRDVGTGGAIGGSSGWVGGGGGSHWRVNTLTQALERYDTSDLTTVVASVPQSTYGASFSPSLGVVCASTGRFAYSNPSGGVLVAGNGRVMETNGAISIDEFYGYSWIVRNDLPDVYRQTGGRTYGLVGFTATGEPILGGYLTKLIGQVPA